MDKNKSKAVTTYIHSLLHGYQMQRRNREEVWLSCWGIYLGNRASISYLRSRVGAIIGDVNDDWRHKINNSKAYEIVETSLSYLISAFFPNDDYFDLAPTQPGYLDVAEVVKRYLSLQLEHGKFRSVWESYLRQLLITGHSVLYCGWERSSKKRKGYSSGNKTTTVNQPVFEVLNVFDCYWDLRGHNPKTLIRRIAKTKEELMAWAETMEQLDQAEVAKRKPDVCSPTTTQREFLDIEYNPNDLVYLYEFWGDLMVDNKLYQNQHCLVLGDMLLVHEDSPYWCGLPFVIGGLTSVPNTAVAQGILEPVLGMLQQLNVITNQRLDSLELAIDSMWMLVEDGVTDLDELHTEPGKVIRVGTPNALQPVQPNTSFIVSYQETALLEQAIERATGLLPFVGSQPGRTGERVTATEVQAVRDVGGVRLNGIFTSIEQSQFLPCLYKAYENTRQFTETDTVIRLSVSGGAEYIQVGPRELDVPFEVVPKSATHVVQKEKNLKQLLDFVSLASSLPQWSNALNFEYLLTETARRFGFNTEQIKQLLKPPAPPEQEQEVPLDPNLLLQSGAQQAEAEALQSAQAIGGQPQVDNLLANYAMTGNSPATQLAQAVVPTP